MRQINKYLLPILIACTCLCAHVAQAVIYTQTLIVALGTANSGQTANVRYTVYDNTNVSKLTALGALAEDTDDGGTANTGTYRGSATFDTAWAYPLRIKYTVSGLSGVSASVVIGSERIAEISDGYTLALGTKLNTATPSTAPGTAGGVITFGTGTGQLNPSGGNVVSSSANTVTTGTATAGAASTISLAGALTFPTGTLVGELVYLTGGTGVGQTRVITAYTSGTNLATVDFPWTTNPDATTTYVIIGIGNVSRNSSLQPTSQLDLTQKLTGSNGWTGVALNDCFQSAWEYVWGKQSANGTALLFNTPDGSGILKQWLLSTAVSPASTRQ